MEFRQRKDTATCIKILYTTWAARHVLELKKSNETQISFIYVKIERVDPSETVEKTEKAQFVK